MALKRCPMCRRLNPDTALRCDCSYVFGQDIDVAIDKLRRQRAAGWATLGVGCLSFAVVIALVAAITMVGPSMIVIPLVGLGGLGAVIRGGRTIAVSRKSLRELTRRKQLPVAYVVER